MSLAILYDSTMCVDCKECERGCAKRWGHPYDDKIASEENISAHKFVSIQTRGDKFARRSCMHCVEPTCASVCPVGAIHADDRLPDQLKFWIAINREFFSAAVTGWGTPGGADLKHTTALDHATVTAWPKRPGR